MINLLTNISEASLLIYIVALVASLISSKYSLDKKSGLSFDFCLSALIALTAIHIYAEIIMLDAANSDEMKIFIRHLWYLFFAFTDLIYVALCLWFFLTFGKSKPLVCVGVVSTVFILGLIQIARYLDRVIIQTDALGAFYKSAIPSLNVIMLSFIIYYAVNLLIKRKGV